MGRQIDDLNISGKEHAAPDRGANLRSEKSEAGDAQYLVEKILSSPFMCTKSDITLEPDYFKKDCYEVTTQYYVKAKAALAARIAELHTMEPPLGVSLANLYCRKYTVISISLTHHFSSQVL